MMMGFGLLMMFAFLALPILLVAGLAVLLVNHRRHEASSTQSAPNALTAFTQAEATPAGRICSHCGARLQAEWSHCPQCGASAS